MPQQRLVMASVFSALGLFGVALPLVIGHDTGDFLRTFLQRFS